MLRYEQQKKGSAFAKDSDLNTHEAHPENQLGASVREQHLENLELLNAELAESQAELAESQAELAERQAQLTESQATVADNAREIAALKAQLPPPTDKSA